MSLSRAGLFEGTLFVVAFFTFFQGEREGTLDVLFFVFVVRGGAPKLDTPKGEGAR